VPLVAPGQHNAHFEELVAASRALGVEDLVSWTGFVSPLELRVMFLDATAAVIPTLFEAASAPLWEAFAAGVAAACSNVTSLPEQAGDAAIVFDPLEVGSIAGAIERLWLDPVLRGRLAERGRSRVGELSWDRTASLFRAHYRRLAATGLTDEDRQLLSAAPGPPSSSRPSSG
jgi:glycosyltransferase involved in cell wall biosynthesis